MLFLNSVRVAPGVRSALAVACGLALSGAQMARADDGVEPVVVTATRFQQSSAAVPANVSVITRQDILAMPGQSVPDILKSVAGVDVRPTYGALGIDATVDVGGFGTTANSNTLVLVDGQRLNPIDMGGILWSVIPKDGIERIEVIRGSGAVLYGDGASGGVINIITDRAQRKQAQASVSIGSFGYKAGDARLAGKNDLGFLSVNIHHAEEDGYRENNRQHEDSLSGRVGTSLGNSGQVFVDYSVFHDANGLPGGLDSAEYERDPRAANSRFNFQDRNGYRVRPGVSYHINDQLEVSADVAADHQQLKSHFVSTSDSSVSGSDRIRDTLSVSPRVRWQHGLGGLSSETVLGLDISEGNLISTDVGWPNQGGGQSSMSLYAQNITGLTSNLSLTLADRMQRVRQYARQDEYADWGTSSMDDSGTHTQHAYDIGLTYVADSWRVYGKTGTTFRFAKIDELFGYDSMTGSPVFAGDLRPQHGTNNEVGGSVNLGSFKLTGSVYQLDLTDEIGYDGAQFSNVNFDWTRRRGAQTEISWKPYDAWLFKLSYSYVDAQFTNGAYKGKQLPLVPHDIASLLSTWDSGAWGRYSAQIRFVGERAYDGDLANKAGMASGYTTLDLQAAWNIRAWRVTFKVLNALDQHYAPDTVFSANQNKFGYYPADGRAMFVSLGYQF